MIILYKPYDNFLWNSKHHAISLQILQNASYLVLLLLEKYEK